MEGLFGADEETRTPDILHGKQVLYQLSYIRLTVPPEDGTEITLLLLLV